MQEPSRDDENQYIVPTTGAKVSDCDAISFFRQCCEQLRIDFLFVGIDEFHLKSFLFFCL
jgi:hypothetical protein